MWKQQKRTYFVKGILFKMIGQSSYHIIQQVHPKKHQWLKNRVPTGPVATLVSQQENRLHAVETAIQKLQDQQQQQSTQAEQRMRVMDENFQQHVVQTQQAFEHVNREQRELHTSIQTALQRQDERMAKSFDDLKALFLSSRGTKRNEPTAEEDELDM